MNKTEKKPDKPGGACKHCPWGKRIHQRLMYITVSRRFMGAEKVNRHLTGSLA